MIGWILAGLVAWWLLAQNKSKASVAASGSLNNLSLDNASMGAHGAPKAAGGTATVTVSWSGSTKNAQGQGIPWRYQVRVVAQQGSTFSFTGAAPIAVAGSLKPETALFTLNIPAVAPAGLYSLTAFLMAEGSDAQGKPTGVFKDIPGVSLTHSNAINIGGPVTPQGGIGSVDVAQILQTMRL